MNDVLDKVCKARLVAILRGVPRDKTELLAEALLEGGVTIFEITCNTLGALVTIERLAKRFDGAACLGAGTVMDSETVRHAADAGARFILSPDVNVDVVRAAKQRGLLSVPGAMTATEVVAANNAGADIIKIFPAGSLGPGYIKNLLGPLDAMRFMVVGGVDLGNLRAFYDAGAMSAGVGGCLIQKSLVDAGDWKGLKTLAARFVAEAAP